MEPFETAEQAASWSCVCPERNSPGNHEGVANRVTVGPGRVISGRAVPICEAAWGASRTKKSLFHAQYARICAQPTLPAARWTGKIVDDGYMSVA